MATDAGSVPKSGTLPLETRIALAQIDALFQTVTIGVAAAAAGAIILAVCLRHLGFLDPRTGQVWLFYIVSCAACHFLLGLAYRRSTGRNDRWQAWAISFTTICLAEGFGWGWATISMPPDDRFDVASLVALMIVALVAGAIPALSPYLPAFFTFILPATLPFMAVYFRSVNPVWYATSWLMLLFIGAMTGLGIASNRSFKQQVRLRILAEDLSADLQRQKEIAEKANLAKSNFLAAASHDLRQPIHALGLFVAALRGVAMPEEGKRLVARIEESTTAMDGLFAALLDISRLDAGVVEVHRRAFPIQQLLERVCHEHEGEARAKGLRLNCAPCAAIVETDPVLLERILRNLVSNALRHSQRGRVVAGCRRRGRTLAVQVWDTGPGIPPAARELVFQEYFQLGNPERDRAKGLGLGLAIVRRLADLLDCELVLRSRAGGSCFEVSVPLARGAAVAEDRTEPAPMTGALGRGRIMVIDDEASIREAMAALLTRWGHDVVTAGSGAEAAGLAAHGAAPDLIICDYRLRNSEAGITVIERLRAGCNAPIPAMLITGDTAPDRLAEAQASGLLLLHKPVSNSKLRAAIINLAKIVDNDGMIDAKSSAVK